MISSTMLNEYNIDPKALHDQTKKDLQAYFPHFSLDDRDGDSEMEDDNLLAEYHDLLAESLGNREQAERTIAKLQARYNELEFTLSISCNGKVKATNIDRLNLYKNK